MSVNFGGNPPLVPMQPPVPVGQPPQPPQAEANPPTVSVRAISSSSAGAPLSSSGDLPSTEPALSTHESAGGADALPGPTADAFLTAVQCGDLVAVNRILDQGLDIGLSIAGTTLLESAMTHVSDQATLNRILGLADPERRNRDAPHLWHACQTGNAVAMECLLNWRVPHEESLSAEIDACVSEVMTKGSAAQWAAAFRLLRRCCPEQKPDLALFLKTLAYSLDLDCLKVLTVEFAPGLPRNRKLVEGLLQAAMQAQRVDFAAELIDWVKAKGRLRHGVAFPLNGYVLQMNDTEVVFLAKARYPFHSGNLPLPRNAGRADEVQGILFGETLARSAVGRRMHADASGAKNLVQLILKCYSPTLGKDAWQLGRQKTERTLFFAGFRRPLVTPLVDAMVSLDPSLGRQRSHAVFVMCSLLNELQANDDLKNATDPLLRSQLEAIIEAASDTLQTMIGRPVSFFAAMLTCVSTDAGIDNEKLSLIFRERKGLPPLVVDQLEVALSVAFEAAMECKSELQLDAGATYRQVQSMMKKHILLSMMKSLWTSLPASLQSHAVIAGKPSDRERIAMHVAITVITQYCALMKADIGAAALQVWQESASLAADAFDSSSDGLSSSDSDIDADEATSDDERVS